jgi:hypothetical protein
MHRAIRRSRITRLGFYFAAVALVAIVWRVQHYMDALTVPPPNTIISSFSSSGNPNQWQQIGFQAVSQMDGLLTTLATALLGALGLLLVRVRAGQQPRHLGSAFVSGVFVGLSLYFGYVGHLHVLYMIHTETFDPFSLLYILPSHSQFYALLLGFFFFGDFAVHDLSEEK